jgi:hypothetical protein
VPYEDYDNSQLTFGTEADVVILDRLTPKILFLASMTTCPLVFFLGLGFVTLTVQPNNRYFAMLGVLSICLLANLLFLVSALLLGALVRRFRESWYTWLTPVLMIGYCVIAGKIGGH